MLLDAIRNQDEQQDSQDESVVFDLVRLLTGRGAERAGRACGPTWRSWPTGAKLPVTRQLGFVALIAADGSVDKAWALAHEVAVGACKTWSTPCR